MLPGNSSARACLLVGFAHCNIVNTLTPWAAAVSPLLQPAVRSTASCCLQVLLGDVFSDLPAVSNFGFSDATEYGADPDSPFQVRDAAAEHLDYMQGRLCHSHASGQGNHVEHRLSAQQLPCGAKPDTVCTNLCASCHPWPAEHVTVSPVACINWSTTDCLRACKRSSGKVQ
jgi:hypothetical protein